MAIQLRWALVAYLALLSSGAAPQTAGLQSIRETPLFLAFVNPDAPFGLAGALARLPGDVREDTERRLAARRRVVPTLPEDRGAQFLGDVIAGARRNHEAAILALIGPSAAAEAADFASTVRLFYEWEGYAEPPLTEAESAAGYLAGHAGSAITGYVRLFLLHRYRAAFEAALWERSQRRPGGGDAAAQQRWSDQQQGLADLAGLRYRETFAALEREIDPVIRALALDLDDRSAVYVSVPSHPRRPDSPR